MIHFNLSGTWLTMGSFIPAKDCEHFTRLQFCHEMALERLVTRHLRSAS